MKAKRKILFIIIGIIIVIIIGLTGAYLYKNRNAKTVTPKSEITVNITAFYQKDELWKDDNLGESKYKMGDSGCLTTCVTSMILMQDIKIDEISPINPETVNEYFSEKGVYDTEGNLDWSMAGNALGVSFVRKETSDITDSDLENLLKKGIYPIVCVKMPSGNYHFVLLVGSDENSFLCMDPLNENGEAVSLEKFDNKIYSVNYFTQAAENEILDAEEIIEEQKYYKLAKSENLYYYEIYDENGDVVKKSDKYPKPPKLSMPNKHLIKCTYQTGTGISTQWGFYYDVKKDVFSKTFIGGLYDDYEDKIIYREKDKLIVRNIFDKTDYYDEISSFKYPFAKTVEPFINAKFLDKGSKVEVTYLTGENYAEVTEIIDLA